MFVEFKNVSYILLGMLAFFLGRGGDSFTSPSFFLISKVCV